MKHSILYISGLCHFIGLLFALIVGIAGAIEPVEVKPEYEKRYHDLLSELRCLVCQNQTIEESNSELAHDLRVEVNKLLNNGASDSEIIEFMANRYGDFVLYKPLIKPKTYLLWFGPFIFLAAILFLVLMFVKKQKPTSKVELSVDEQQKLESILKETKK
ncbi:MAG: cytochrome c-type biogenesis protein CcmH [Gammaproteobacteria bacterium]|nr:cytochrome c-type biogenesis protein CcmH [Gammaproteobacteria bacterium]NNC68613.1 cytochrome c-type biogenesis protein CcmH [Gammaproteobacteria bacterium]